ncbi:hypothetical protein ACS0TY_020098 [Phlomoides rotata]
MLVSVFLALFLPCAGMSAVFLVYICLLCYAASTSNNDEQQFSGPVKLAQNKGLSAPDLEKLPKVTGKDLVLGTDCAVCLDEIEIEQSARMIPGCNHGFHLECADRIRFSILPCAFVSRSFVEVDDGMNSVWKRN